MRLDKFLAHAVSLSRTLAKQVIRQQRVVINNSVARNASQNILDSDKIIFDGTPLTLPGKRYIMLHKPADYVCTRDDSHHADVFSLIEHSHDLHAAGRLDADTTGLVLLTNDGQWSHCVTAPRRHCNKTYLTTLTQPLTSEQSKQLEQGVMLNGEDKPTLPATIEKLSDLKIRLTIHQGKYHQVKRMMAAVGNIVIALHRERIGDIKLDSSLQAGAWRELTPDEYQSFK